MKAIDQDNNQEILDDINNIIFSVVDIRLIAKRLWLEIRRSYYAGATETELYDQLAKLMKENS